MKYVKMIGLAAVAAMALMAFAGAGTASATVLCKNNLNTEKCSEPYGVGTVGEASMSPGTSGVIESLGGETLNTCTKSTIKETLQNAGSSITTVTGKIAASSFSWTGCGKPVSVLAGGESELHWIAGTDNGTLTAKGFEITFSFAGSSCVYGLGSTMKDWGLFEGGGPGSLSINSVIPRISGGFLCPTEARLTGTYVNTAPEKGYVTAG